MAKKSYKFNPQTLTYEAIQPPVRLRVYRALRKIFIGFILASIITFAFSYFFYTPKMYAINRSNSELRLKYAILQDKINTARTKLEDIRHRDTYVYRKLFGTDSMTIEGVHEPYPAQKYASLTGDTYSSVLLKSWMDLDALARTMYLESKSLDELQSLARDKETMALSVPAIWPIDRRLMNSPHIGRYGYRNHPILGSYRMHTGIDLGAPRGTPVYVTGNGVVSKVASERGGYGNYIIVDHGLGYKTRYAHLNKSLVVTGQTVKRGEVIGEVGNTGRSTGPHLHYEVILMDKTVDPLNYFRQDMDETEFEQIIEMAKDTTFEEFD